MPKSKNGPMTVDDVAKKIGVTKRTLYNWFYSGKIPEADRDRNNWRIFDEKDLQAILTYANKKTVASHKLQTQLFTQPASRA